MGDLLAQRVDALVNPWNRNFVPRWLLRPHGVSGQLKARTGPRPWRDLARRGILQLGEATVTDGGAMPVDLIHVAGINAAWRASPDSVRRSCVNAVRVAWAAGYGSLALPLIGSGSGSMTPQDSRASLKEALAAFAQPTDGERMLVRIVAPQLASC